MSAYSKMTKPQLIAEVEALEVKNLELSSKIVAAEELAEQRKALLTETQSKFDTLHAWADRKSTEIKALRPKAQAWDDLQAKRSKPSTWQPGTVVKTYDKQGEKWEQVRSKSYGVITHRKVEAA